MAGNGAGKGRAGWRESGEGRAGKGREGHTAPRAKGRENRVWEDRTEEGVMRGRDEGQCAPTVTPWVLLKGVVKRPFTCDV